MHTGWYSDEAMERGKEAVVESRFRRKTPIADVSLTASV